VDEKFSWEKPKEDGNVDDRIKFEIDLR
jgi:hypothetical protein